MDRIVVRKRTDLGWERDGWFDLDAATHILTENTRWNGQNYIGIISGLTIGRSHLYRTKGGRWVDHTDASREFDGPDRWVFLDDTEARQWMINSGNREAEKALAEWFPETPDEAGPGSQGGRPAIGPAISIAYPVDLLRRIDAAAKADGMTRAAWLRRTAENALA